MKTAGLLLECDGMKMEGGSEEEGPLPSFLFQVWERMRLRNRDWWSRTRTYGVECDQDEPGWNLGWLAWKAGCLCRRAAVFYAGGECDCALGDDVSR